MPPAHTCTHAIKTFRIWTTVRHRPAARASRQLTCTCSAAHDEPVLETEGAAAPIARTSRTKQESTYVSKWVSKYVSKRAQSKRVPTAHAFQVEAHDGGLVLMLTFMLMTMLMNMMMLGGTTRSRADPCMFPRAHIRAYAPAQRRRRS